jgi:NNP family nitrate/nitrite transporter-like MFS transporter
MSPFARLWSDVEGLGPAVELEPAELRLAKGTHSMTVQNTTAPVTRRGAIPALVLATVGFAVNFWAWALLTPLSPTYKDLLALSPLAVSVLVAVPVIVGSLGRIPLGALTDRYGGRAVFAAASLFGVIPVVFLAFAENYSALLVGGFALGITGATFAVGVPFVNAWFPPERRGLALGIFGMGNIGTAISGFVTPRLSSAFGRPAPFLVVAVALVLVGLAFLTMGRNASWPWSPSPAARGSTAAAGRTTSARRSAARSPGGRSSPSAWTSRARPAR